jgi:hypothetical protein
MGRQVRFFMDRNDEKRFVEFVRSSRDVVILPYDSPDPRFPPLNDLPDYSSDNFSFMLWLFNPRVSSRLETDYVPEQHHYTIDRDTSSVVEFSRTIREGNIVRPGRLWAEFKYLDPDRKWALKEPEFKKWYESLAKWIRKNYSREIDPDFYFGPGALKLVKEGGVEVRYF